MTLLLALWLLGADPVRTLLWAEGLPVEPVVRVVPATAPHDANCADDGAGTLRCVAWCEGCAALEADGVTLWGRHRVYLGMVHGIVGSGGHAGQ